MISFLFGVLIILLIAFLTTLVLSPLEALHSAQYGDMLEVETPRSDPSAAPGADVYVVFVSGIGSISGQELLPAEARFLDRLDAGLPNARIVRDMFPYAPSGRPLLTGQRFFSWFWRVVSRKRDESGPVLPMILNVRNLYQVLVSADDRYGPLYSHSIAHVAADRLAAAGYSFGSATPVILLGSSGGGQISVGAVTYLKRMTKGPVYVVTFGGVMSSDPGIADADRLVSFFGEDDAIYRLGRIGFPGRWASSFASTWNIALAENRLVETDIGAISHSGAGGYLDAEAWKDGHSRLDATVDAIVGAVNAITRSGTSGEDRA